jgi:hypothetical protein
LFAQTDPSMEMADAKGWCNMKPERRSFKSWLGETLDYQESQQIDSVILETMVERLREGDRSMIDPIIAGHYRLVTAIIAGSIRKRGKSADIEGAAFLALVEAVNDCCPHWEGKEYLPSRLYDNNITFYITTTVKFAIKDEYGADHIVRVPARTIRAKIADGEKFEDLVPKPPIEIGGDYAEDFGISNSLNGMIMPFYIPIARNDFPSIEFNEALAKCTRGPMEEAIINLRKEGFTYQEVGKKVGYSDSMIAVIMPQIEARFDKLYP